MVRHPRPFIAPPFDIDFGLGPNNCAAGTPGTVTPEEGTAVKRTLLVTVTLQYDIGELNRGRVAYKRSLAAMT
jgi:hypothetical protein